jgi:hypothetical protein
MNSLTEAGLTDPATIEAARWVAADLLDWGRPVELGPRFCGVRTDAHVRARQRRQDGGGR